MTLLLRLALPLFASLLLPAAALAQQAQAATPATPAAPAQASAPGKGESQALQLFKLLDANGDGRVSWA